MDPAVRVTETKIELVDDTQVLNEDFKKNVAIPYFKDIYKDLVQQSDNKSKGINKLSILTVSGRVVPIIAKTALLLFSLPCPNSSRVYFKMPLFHKDLEKSEAG